MAHGVARLATLYARVEQLRALELEVAATAVNEVLRVEGRERDECIAQMAAARVALTDGDRSEWLLVNRELDLQQNRLQVLVGCKEARERLREQALAAHRASRMDREQMTRVVEEQRRMQSVEAERRNQAISDDRYLSRRLWQQHDGQAGEIES